ncbi:hypothetical protein D3C87_1935150 [compost metagenome]
MAGTDYKGRQRAFEADLGGSSQALPLSAVDQTKEKRTDAPRTAWAGVEYSMGHPNTVAQ